MRSALPERSTNRVPLPERTPGHRWGRVSLLVVLVLALVTGPPGWAEAVGPPGWVEAVGRPAWTAAIGSVPGRPAPTGTWVWPLERLDVARPFRPPAVRWGPGHRGVDLRAAVGSEVRAVGAGEVGFAGMVAGRGVVTVRHGRLRTTYEPVDATVHPGQRVAAGSVIGRLSTTAVPGAGHCPPASCLHLGLIAGRGTYLDPMSLFRPVQVRLLPRRGWPIGSRAGPRELWPDGPAVLAGLFGPAVVDHAHG